MPRLQGPGDALRLVRMLAQMLIHELRKATLVLLVGVGVMIRSRTAMPADPAGGAVEAADHPVALVVQPQQCGLVMSVVHVTVEVAERMVAQIGAAGMDRAAVIDGTIDAASLA